MAWIKKNLVFVVCSGIAVLLLAVAVWFLFSNKGRDAAIQEELNQELSNWQSLNSGGSFPNQENIDAVKAEQEKFKKLWKEAASVVPVKTAPPKMSDQAFAGLLGSTIAELRSTAASTGVVLPPQYDFTFAGQRKALNFPAASIETWLMQLNDIKAICNVLYQSRISALDALQRVPVSELDGGTDALAGATVVSNQFAYVMPYRVTFRGFGPEIASVFDQIQRATNFMILKSVSVIAAPGGFVSGDGSQPVPSAGYRNVGQSAPQEFFGGPTAPPPPQRARPGVPATAAAPVAETILSEQPLQVTLLLDVVKLNPVQ